MLVDDEEAWSPSCPTKTTSTTHSQTSHRLICLPSSRKANYRMPSRSTPRAERLLPDKIIARLTNLLRPICQTKKVSLNSPSRSGFINLIICWSNHFAKCCAISWLLVRILFSVALINFVLRFNFKMTIHLQNIIKLNLIDSTINLSNISFSSSTCVCSVTMITNYVHYNFSVRNKKYQTHFQWKIFDKSIYADLITGLKVIYRQVKIIYFELSI